MSIENDTATDEFYVYRSQCWDNAIHTFGTSYIFQQRARALKRKLLWVNYVGVAVPLLVGGLVLTFGTFSLLPMIIAVAGVILALQAVVNLWAIMGGWVDAHSYANTSASANDSLSMRYRELGQNPPSRLDDLRHMYDKLQIEDKARRDLDHQQNIKESELRMGMRAALRKFQRKCAGCDKVPASIQPSNCDVCGNFKYSDS